MRQSAILRYLSEFVCEPPQVFPLPTALSVLFPSTASILCWPLAPTFTHDPEQAEDVAAAHSAEVDPLRMRSLLFQPFSKSQLIDLLFSAASTRPDLLEDIRAVARRNPHHRKAFVSFTPRVARRTASVLKAALSDRFGADSVEYALVAPDRTCGIVLFRRLADAHRAICPPLSQDLDGGGSALFMPLQPWPTPDGRARRAVVARFWAERSAARLANMGALLARYGAIAEGPAWVNLHVSSSDGRRTVFPSAAYVVYEEAAAADAAVADNPKVVEGSLVFCERVVHINEQAQLAHPLPPPPLPPPPPPPPPTDRREGPGPGQGTKRRRLELDLTLRL